MSAKDLRNTECFRPGQPLLCGGHDTNLHDLGNPVMVGRRFVEAIVPRLADFAAVHLLDGVVLDAAPRALAPGRSSLHRIVSMDATMPCTFGALLPPDRIIHCASDSAVLVTLARGEYVHIPNVDDATADQLAADLATPGLAEALRQRSVLMLPLMSDATLIGNTLLIGEPDRPVHGEPEIAMFEELARWTADGIEHALRYRRERQLADHLLREAGPQLPPHPAGIELGYRYLPHGGRTHRLGGDWFDAIPLPGGRTALIVGDVAGHGTEAAIKMSQCKTMVRTLASLDLPPDQLLRRFDLLIERQHSQYGGYDDFLATCAYAIYDPVSRECSIASAGHVPPVLVRPDGRAELLRPITGLPIGIGSLTSFESYAVSAADGSLLALYSDGLVETRHRDIEDGIQAVVAQLQGPRRALEQICDEVLARLTTDDRDDDVTLLLARLLGPRPSAPVTRTSISRPHSCPETSDEDPALDGQQAGPAKLIGRGRELDEIQRLLTCARLVTLSGAAGVGKSTLARRAAERAASDHPNGVRLIELSAVRDPARFPGAVAAALGLTECSDESWDDAIARELADKRMLLVLDTCEHLTRDCARFVGRLLRAAPEVRVLITSRQPLRINGEHIVGVTPLELDDAVALFTASAVIAAPGFTLPAANAEIVRKLCQRLEGIPLAIELAAGRLSTLSLDDLVTRLDDKFEVLAAVSCPPLARHQNLRAAIGWSHELCEPRERLLWARLSVFSGDFDLAAAEFVCADAELPRGEILELMARLVRKSIVIPEKWTVVPRFAMLDTLQEYGREQLALLGDSRSLQRRLRDWYRHTAVEDESPT